MIDWEKEVDDGLKEFRAQGNRPMRIMVIPAGAWEGLIKAGDDGDLEARQVVTAISRWFDLANAAVEDSASPFCLRCDTVISPAIGNLGGFVMLFPVGNDQTGVTAAVCCECIGIDKLQLVDKFKELLQEATGGVLMSMQ